MEKKNNFKEAIVGFFKKLSKKQLIAMIAGVLAVAILVPVIIVIATNDNGKTPVRKPPVSDQTTTPPSSGNPDGDDPDTPLVDMPEKIDLNGYVFRAYVRSNAATGGDTMEDGNPSFFCEDFWVDPNLGEPSDALEYAVYHRNNDIETDYNVKIRQVKQTINMTQELGRFYQDGQRYDLTIIHAKSAATAATQNLLTELKGLTTLNLKHESFDQNSIKELSMGGKLYYLSGDMNISTLDSVAPTVVNIERYENYAEGIVEHFKGDTLYADVYNLVTAGKWTMGTMLEIAAIASSDADTSDGDLGSSDQDNVGYFQYDQSAVYYFYGAGGRLTQMTEEGSPEFVVGNPVNQELYDYIYDNFHPNVRNIKYPHGYSGDRQKNFITNANTLFTDMTLWDVRKDLFPNAGFRYGVLPTPVYNEGDPYNAVVYFYNTVHLWAIPNLCEDLETAQIMMNVLAAYSNSKIKDSTMYSYYTKTLYFSVAPDPNARKVMDIIKDSTVYDIALLYDWGGWRTHFSEIWYRLLPNEYGALVNKLPTDAIPKLEETIELFKNPEILPTE